jgi:hypothetical protein
VSCLSAATGIEGVMVVGCVAVGQELRKPKEMVANLEI